MYNGGAMKPLLALLLCVCAAPTRAAELPLYPQRSTAPIIVVWPPEGAVMPAGIEGEFIFGSVIDPKSRFQINGQTVGVHRNGAFLAWLPVKPGTFTFECSLALPSATTAYLRAVQVPAPAAVLPPRPLSIDETFLQPKADAQLRPGDWLTLRMRASPGHPAQYRLGRQKPLPMRETSPGLYEAIRLIGPEDVLEPSPVEYRLGGGWERARATGQAKISLTSALVPAVVRSTSPIKTGPSNGYMIFPLSGTKLLTSGRLGSDVRIQLSPSHEGWMAAKDLEFFPDAPPPRAVTGAISVAGEPASSVVRIALSEKVPFDVEEAEDLGGLTVRLFYTDAHSNWIVYDSADGFIDSIRWRQESAGVVAVTIRLAQGQTLWGWQPSFEGGALKLELRKPPILAAAPASVFRKVKIMLDAGHMPSAPGSVGPMGTKEMDANYAIAKAAGKLLSNEGALTTLTRATTDHEVSLVDRPRLAVEQNVDLFVSLHNNALPDGENPFAKPRGFSVFYYHPHSLALGKAVYRSYAKRVPLPGEELRYGDLHVARLSAVPAILVESAYMIIPAQEEKLNDNAFRSTLARAIVEGLRQFLEKERQRQHKNHSARKDPR